MTPAALDVVARTAIDLLALGLLTLALFLPRHRRRDLVTVFCLFNAGLFGVLLVMNDGDIGVGAGLGLFGVLSIVRLRSEQYRNVEIGYFFVALALALVAALAPGPLSAAGLAAGLLLVTLVVDAQRLLPGTRAMDVVLDDVLAEPALSAELVRRLGVGVEDVGVVEVDYVRQSMRLVVRMRPVTSARFLRKSAMAR